MAVLCLLSIDMWYCCCEEDDAIIEEDDSAFIEDEEAAIIEDDATADFDELAAIMDEEPWAIVPLSTTAPLALSPPSIRLSILALSDLASTTWDDLTAEDEADDDLTMADDDDDDSTVADCCRDVNWLCSISVAYNLHPIF